MPTPPAPHRPPTPDPAKFELALEKGLATDIANFKAQGITVPPALIQEFEAGIAKLKGLQNP